MRFTKVIILKGHFLSDSQASAALAEHSDVLSTKRLQMSFATLQPGCNSTTSRRWSHALQTIEHSPISIRSKFLVSARRAPQWTTQKILGQCLCWLLGSSVRFLGRIDRNFASLYACTLNNCPQGLLKVYLASPNHSQAAKHHSIAFPDDRSMPSNLVR